MSAGTKDRSLQGLVWERGIGWSQAGMAADNFQDEWLTPITPCTSRTPPLVLQRGPHYVTQSRLNSQHADSESGLRFPPHDTRCFASHWCCCGSFCNSVMRVGCSGNEHSLANLCFRCWTGEAPPRRKRRCEAQEVQGVSRLAIHNSVGAQNGRRGTLYMPVSGGNLAY